MDFVKIAARVAADEPDVPGGMAGKSVLNQAVEVDIPELGTVPVVLTQAEMISENRWKGVKGTINGIPFETSGGKHREDENVLGPGLEALEGDYRPIDAAASALMVLLDEETYGEFAEVVNGVAIPLESEDDPGPPSDPGSPYDTLEEKRGEK